MITRSGSKQNHRIFDRILNPDKRRTLRCVIEQNSLSLLSCLYCPILRFKAQSRGTLAITLTRIFAMPVVVASRPGGCRCVRYNARRRDPPRRPVRLIKCRTRPSPSSLGELCLPPRCIALVRADPPQFASCVHAGKGGRGCGGGEVAASPIPHPPPPCHSPASLSPFLESRKGIARTETSRELRGGGGTYLADKNVRLHPKYWIL